MFSLHENVLHQSPFFANALRPEWVAACVDKLIVLEKEDPHIFAGYVQWLYSHNIDTTFNKIKWAEMYVLGETLMDSNFQNKVLETMVQRCETKNSYPAGIAIDIIYKGTPEGSPAWHLLVDYYVWGARSSWFKGQNMATERPADFINDLLLTLVSRRPSLSSSGKGEKPWITDVSRYFVKLANPETEEKEKEKAGTTKST
jgi:hypothetical protein